nr:hypothetical protein [Edaphobacter aggregans]
MSLGDAGGKRSTPLLKDGLEPLAEEFALGGGLETEIADQAAAIPFVGFEEAADDVEIALQALPGSEGVVAQSVFDVPLEVGKVAIQHLLGKCLFGTEVIGEGAVRSASGCADVAYARPVVSRLEHDLEAGVIRLWFRDFG